MSAQEQDQVSAQDLKVTPAVEVTLSPRQALRCDLLLKLAQVYQQHLQIAEAAVETYEEMFELRPHDSGAIHGLQTLFATGQIQYRIADILKPIYMARQEWRPLYDQNYQLISSMELGDQRQNAILEIASIAHEQLGEVHTALWWYGEGFKENPLEDQCRAHLHELATAHGYHDQLLQIYTEGRAQLQEVERLCEISYHIADLYVNHYQEWERAEQEYRYILEVDTTSLRSLEGLDRVYSTLERWIELEDVLRQELLYVSDESQSMELTWRLAQVYEARLERPRDAINQYNELLLMNAEHGGALDRLEALYSQDQDALSLFDIYERKSEFAEDEDLINLHKKMAYLASEELERPMDAIEIWSQIIEVAPNDPDALAGLEVLYENEEDWRELVRICDQQIENANGDVATELKYYAKLGKIWGEHLERTQKALECWAEVLTRDATNTEARWEMRALFIQEDQTDELMHVDLELLELFSEDEPRRVLIYCELGRQYDLQELTEEAITAWQSALHLSPGLEEPVERLLEIFSDREDWSEYVLILNQKAEHCVDPDERLILCIQLAELYEVQLDQPEVSIAVYLQILESIPTHIEAYEHLERLYRQLEQWEHLINLLLSRLEVTDELLDRQEVYERIADVFEEQDAAENALMILGRAFSEDPNDERFGERLEKLASLTGQWAELIQHYENSLSQIGQDQPESIPLHLRVAQWYDEAVEQPQHAVTHYQFVQHIDPENIDVFKSLETLYEKHGHWALAVQMIEQRLPLLYETDDLLDAWRTLSSIKKQHLEDFDGALIAYQEVLALEPNDLEALNALKELYSIKQEFQNLITILEQENDLIEDVELQVENYLRIAELKEVRLHDMQGAIYAYQEAHNLDSNCADALYSLEVLYRQSQDWYALQETYNALLIARHESLEQLKTYGKLARLQLEHLEDRIGAIDTYRNMFRIDPTHPDAIRSLDQLYREENQWDDLKKVYDQYLEKVTSPTEQISIRIALSKLCEFVYTDPQFAQEQAVAYLSPIVEEDPTQLEAIQILKEIYATAEQWHDCLEMLQSEINLISDRELLIERMYQMGMIYFNHLDDAEQAIHWFKQLLELMPTYTPALIALKEVYERKGQYHDMVRVLTMMEANTKDYKEKSSCYYEMGRIYAQLLGDTNTGIDYYQQAIDLDPENVDVAPYLVDFYLKDEHWERAEPLLDLLLTDGITDDPAKVKLYHYQLGVCAQSLRKDHKALEHFRHSHRLDSTHYPTLKGLADIHLRHEQWEDASNVLQAILIHYSDKFETEERVDILFKQGLAKFRVGDSRRALDVLTRVIESDPYHQEALNLLIESYEQREKWDDSIFYRKRRLETLKNETERFEEWMKIGEVYESQQGNPRSAIEAFQEALQINEGSKRIFGKLLPLYEKVEDWDSTINLLSHFAQRENDEGTKAKYFFAIGSLQRDQLRDNLQAVRSFDKALDADPNMLKAFSAIEGLLTEERNFERQDRYFRKMLKRANDHQMSPDMVFELATALGEINRSRLSRFGEAIKAYNIALSKKPDSIETHEIIAELYELESQWDRAIAQHREILTRDIRQMGSFHKLFRLFVSQGAYDEAWCIAQALVCLRHANPEETGFYEQHHSRSLTEIRRVIENDHWVHLIHPKKSHLMDQLFEKLYAYNAPVMVQNHQKDFGVHKRKGVLSPQDQTPFNHVIDYVSRITRFERLPCYSATSGVSGLRAMNTQPPAILVGQDMTRSIGMQIQAFSLSKILFMMTPHGMMSALDLDYEARRNRLMIIIFTLMKMAGISIEQYDEGLIKVYRQISELDLSKLNELLNEMQKDQRRHLDVSRWLEGLDHTANRLGFLICNDLVSAAQAIRNESTIVSRASVAERIQELVLFSISDEYFHLRRNLGIGIRTS